MSIKESSSAFVDSKPHYEVLDALRGVAALLVVWYHVFEGFSFAGGGLVTTVNHGYLAVDFFFMLSGFVLSYAYDDRLGKSLSLDAFFKRRLIRLHPMVIMGLVTGAVTFLIQGSVRWDGSHVSLSFVMLAMLCALFMVPAAPGLGRDVRGNGEMFPLNGPNWSLFFEYIGNVIYALLIRRLSNKGLGVMTIAVCIALAWFNIADLSGYGSLGVGWTLDGLNFFGGLLRMLAPMSLGMLLARNFRPVKVRGAFLICSLVLLVLFHVPYIAPNGGVNLNGIFEMACILLVFPVLVWLGASGSLGSGLSLQAGRVLGNISYPLYITHYPFMYLFYSWLIRKELYTLRETWPVVIMLIVWLILYSFACLKLYDEPVRRRLKGIRNGRAAKDSR